MNTPPHWVPNLSSNRFWLFCTHTPSGCLLSAWCVCFSSMSASHWDCFRAPSRHHKENKNVMTLLLCSGCAAETTNAKPWSFVTYQSLLPFRESCQLWLNAKDNTNNFYMIVFIGLSPKISLFKHNIWRWTALYIFFPYLPATPNLSICLSVYQFISSHALLPSVLPVWLK